jgi:hypothetical protein
MKRSSGEMKKSEYSMTLPETITVDWGEAQRCLESLDDYATQEKEEKEETG